MTFALVHGAAITLGALLISAGVLKVHAPVHAAAAFRRILPRRWRPATAPRLLVGARALGTLELGTGVLLLATDGSAAVAMAALGAATYCGFAAVIMIAVRRGASCGCWASLSDGPAAGAELGRAMALCAVAGLLVAGRAGGDTAAPLDAPGAVAALALLALTFLTAAAGSRILPARTGGETPGAAPARRRQSAGDAARLVAGAIRSRHGALPAAPPTSRRRLVGAERDALVAQLREDPAVVAVAGYATAAGGALQWQSAAVSAGCATPGSPPPAVVALIASRAGTVTVIAPAGGQVAVVGTLGAVSVFASGQIFHVTPLAASAGVPTVRPAPVSAPA